MPKEQIGSSSNESDTDNSTVLRNGEDFYHSYMTMIFLLCLEILTMSRLTVELVKTLLL